MAARGVLGFALFSALVPAACSGDSTSSGDSNAGKAGATSGGTAGANAGTSGATSGGKAGMGGSGEGGAAGSAGNAGSAGGSGEGATSNGGVGGEGGATAAGGAPMSSGGEAGDAPDPGAAGAGAMRGYHPPGAQIAACDAMCEREAAANCPNDGTITECFDGCRVGIQFEACSAAWDGMFECSETVGEVTCDANGEGAVPECAAEYAVVIDCVFNDNLDEGYVPRCEGYCAALQPAACDNTEPVEDCENTCVILGSAFPVCADAYTDFLECGTGADITCDAEGQPAAEDCASEYVLFLSCLVSEYDWQL